MFTMSKRIIRLNIGLPKYVLEYLDDLAEKLECSRSDTIAEIVVFLAQYEDEFLAEYDLIGDEDEAEDEAEEDEEDEEDEDEE